MSNSDKKQDATPVTGNATANPASTGGDKSHDNNVKPQAAPDAATPKKEGDAKPAVNEPSHKNG